MQRRLFRWLSGKESACNAEDLGSVSGSGRSPRGEHGNPLQYSCLKNPMDPGTWLATTHGVAKSQTWPTRLSTHTCHSSVSSSLLHLQPPYFQIKTWIICILRYRGLGLEHYLLRELKSTLNSQTQRNISTSYKKQQYEVWKYKSTSVMTSGGNGGELENALKVWRSHQHTTVMSPTSESLQGSWMPGCFYGKTASFNKFGHPSPIQSVSLWVTMLEPQACGVREGFPPQGDFLISSWK